MRRLHELLKREHGLALLMTLQLMVVLLVIVGTVIYYATSNQNHAAYARTNQVAFSLAEAGNNNAVSVVMGASNPRNPALLPPKTSPAIDTTTYPGASIKWWGSYNLVTGIWSVTGRGEVPAPNSGATVKRTITQQLRVSALGATVAGTPAWGGIFIDNQNRACVSLANSVSIAYSLYATGDVCMANTAQITSAATPVSIAGSLTLDNSARVGASISPVLAFHIGVGCRRGGGSFTFPCTTAQSVYVTAQDRVVPPIPKPPIDLPGWYANAKPGPMNTCTSGSFPGGFDNDGVLNRSRTDVDLFPSSPYDCRVMSGGVTIGQIKWSPPNFLINGVVLFDGNIQMNDNETVLYTGRGTVYATGKIGIGNGQNVCAVVSGKGCNFTYGVWDPEKVLLVLVAGSTTDDPDFTFSQSAEFQGARYAATGYSEGQSTKLQGPIIANTAVFGQSSGVGSLPYITLAPGQPGSSSGTTVTPVPGSWVEE